MLEFCSNKTQQNYHNLQDRDILNGYEAYKTICYVKTATCFANSSYAEDTSGGVWSRTIMLTAIKP